MNFGICQRVPHICIGSLATFSLLPSLGISVPKDFRTVSWIPNFSQKVMSSFERLQLWKISFPHSFTSFLSHFRFFTFTKLRKYYVIVCLLFLLLTIFLNFRLALQNAKTEHMVMKISQPIFGILVALTKNEVTKICNEPGILTWPQMI